MKEETKQQEKPTGQLYHCANHCGFSVLFPDEENTAICKHCGFKNNRAMARPMDARIEICPVSGERRWVIAGEVVCNDTKCEHHGDCPLLVTPKK